MKTLLAAAIMLLSLKSSANILEPLYGYMVDSRGIVFQVYSGGCTDRDDFVLKQNQEGGINMLSLYRMNPDYCLALFPYGVKVRFTFSEMGVLVDEHFQILNPLQPVRRQPIDDILK